MTAVRSPIVSLSLAVALCLSGCGASGGPGKAQYTSRANAICAAASAQTGPLVTDATAAAASLSSAGAGVGKRLADDLAQLHRIARTYLARLQRLKQPSGDRAAIERFLNPFASVVDSLGKAATAVAAGQLPQALALLQQAAPVARDATSGAHAYGLHECATVLPALG